MSKYRIYCTEGGSHEYVGLLVPGAYGLYQVRYTREFARYVGCRQFEGSKDYCLMTLKTTFKGFLRPFVGRTSKT